MPKYAKVVASIKIVGSLTSRKVRNVWYPMTEVQTPPISKSALHETFRNTCSKPNGSSTLLWCPTKDGPLLEVLQFTYIQYNSIVQIEYVTSKKYNA